MIHYGHKIEEKMKAMQSEMKQNIKGADRVKGRKPGLKSMIWDKRKK